ncbi:2Fe-2S iron-sulfur cluster-binding protein [Streptomyces sp. CNQ085]|uniref:2Fe-2S iron-sulfur cluster-binding protein n=1 Tax=Streptomyces sp. CNQ085 TaxID=2886944 RepID=UPI002676486A|nr:2Fe-2S iron-sulfur cluster-binding protein [Streptomyces sp. CNQ085]
MPSSSALKSSVPRAPTTCGTGVCFDCLITVNGRPNQRAYLVPARDGDTVAPQEGDGRADLAC